MSVSVRNKFGLRVVSYNIHFWNTQQMNTNLDGLVETLNNSNFDVIGLNEVTRRTMESKKVEIAHGTPRPIVLQCLGDSKDTVEPDDTNKGGYISLLEVLAWRTGAKYVVKGSGFFGNAILSKYPVVSCGSVSLKYGGRTCIYAEIEVPTLSTEGKISKLDIKENNGESSTKSEGSKKLLVFVTHLDHMFEKERLIQWEFIKEYIETTCKNVLDTGSTLVPHIVLGDFNALCEYDYREDGISQILTHRKRSNWETVKFDIINSVLREKYVDVLKNSTLEHGEKQAYFNDDGGKDKKKRVGQLPLQFSHFTTVATCWAGTRIDYIFASASMFDVIGEDMHDRYCWRLDRCRIMRSSASDHLPVVADFFAD